MDKTADDVDALSLVAIMKDKEVEDVGFVDGGHNLCYAYYAINFACLFSKCRFVQVVEVDDL